MSLAVLEANAQCCATHMWVVYVVNIEEVNHRNVAQKIIKSAYAQRKS